MAKDQKVTLNFKMSDGTTKAVSFTVPAGAGGILPPVAEVIDDNTDVQAVAERFFNAMEQKFTEPKVVQYFDVTDAADPTASPKTAFISIVPTDGGKFILASGAIAGSVRQPQVNYAWYNDDGSELVQIMEMMDTYRRGDGVTVEGDGTNAEGLFKVKLSTAANNALVLRTDEDTPGLFVPPTQSLKCVTGSGNFSFGYPDSKSAKNACGKMGTGVYWKVTISLGNAGAGNVAVVPRIWTNNIPCMEDGTLVPYQFIVDYVELRNNAVPSVAVWMVCMGVPTHLMSVTDGTLKKLQRGDNGLTNGLDDLYPLAPDGEHAQEPQWRSEYFYTS